MFDVVANITDARIDEVVHRARIASQFVSWVHIELADQLLIPNVVGVDMHGLADAFALVPQLSVEAHLLVINPEKYLAVLIAAGVKRVIVQIESNDPRQIVQLAKYEEIEVIMAIDAPTQIEEIEPFLEEVVGIHVLTAEVGGEHPPFLPETVEKIIKIHQSYPDLLISAEGGIRKEEVRTLKDAGVSRIVTSKSIFEDLGSVGDAISELENA